MAPYKSIRSQIFQGRFPLRYYSSYFIFHFSLFLQGVATNWRPTWGHFFLAIDLEFSKPGVSELGDTFNSDIDNWEVEMRENDNEGFVTKAELEEVKGMISQLMVMFQQFSGAGVSGSVAPPEQASQGLR